jgi:preprotein translocase subunit YajC
MEPGAAIVRAVTRRPPPRRCGPAQFIPEPSMDNSFLTSIVPLVAVFAIMYFLLIRPQQQRMKQHKQMVQNVRRGDTVVTAGGIVGRVAKVKDDDEIVVEIADNTQVRVLKSTLSDVRAKGSDSAAAKE